MLLDFFTRFTTCYIRPYNIYHPSRPLSHLLSTLLSRRTSRSLANLSPHASYNYQFNIMIMNIEIKVLKKNSKVEAKFSEYN